MQNPTNSELFSLNFNENSLIPTIFPHISLEFINNLSMVQTQMSQKPAYLDDPTCQYPEQTKAFLRVMFGAAHQNQDQMDAQIDAFFGDKQMYQRIISDSKRAYMNLASQMTQLETNKKIDDTIAFTKAITQLQERLLTIQEKAEGLKQIHEFKNMVFEIIANELTPDQRTGIITKMEALTKA